MDIAYHVVALATVAANASIAVADLLRAPFVLANSAEVGVPPSWLGPLATLEAAGAAGIVAGLLWWPALAVAAAGGLTLFFGGAIVAHARAGVWYNIAFPATYPALAAATLVLAVTA